MTYKARLLLATSIIALVIAGWFMTKGMTKTKSIDRDEETTSEAFEALALWHDSRAYPNRDIPNDAYMQGYVSMKESSLLRGGETVPPWRAIGPHNIGGRTIAIAINPLNPNTIYAGAASGGLWRSTSGGVGVSAWQNIPTGFPTLGVSSIAIVPNDTNTMYIGTGETYTYQNAIGGLAIRTTRGSYGIGILKTTNGGATWSKSLDWSANQQRGVWKVCLNPRNPNTLWAATTEGTYKSTNAGATWTLMNTTLMAFDVVINPNDTNQILITCGNLNSIGTGFYRSTNGGTTWSSPTGVPVYGGKAGFCLYPRNPSWVYASVGNGANTSGNNGTWLLRSTDFGATWTILSTTDYATYQGWYSHFALPKANDSSQILTGGINIWKSTNSGSTLITKSDWSAWDFGRTPIGGPEGPPDYSHADHHAFAYHPTNPNIVYFANDGGIFRTTDFGETFQGCNGGYQTTQFYNGFSTSVQDSLWSMGGMQDNASAIYDGQLAWIRVLGGDGTWSAIHPTRDSIMYGAYQNLNVVQSTDRGTTFDNFLPIPRSTPAFCAPYALARSNPNVMYAGSRTVAKSLDGGQTWTTTNNGATIDGNNPALSMAISSTNPNVVYVATAPVASTAKIFTTRSGGTTWTNITGSLPSRYPIDMAVDPANDSIAYVVYSGFGTSHCYKTTNAGASWINIGNGLPDVPTSSIAIDPSNRNMIYVGNDLGVFVSADGGTSWQTFTEGMPEAAIVMDLTIIPASRKLRAVTHGRGVYERPLMSRLSVVSDNKKSANAFRLEQNYPNPFNPSTGIRYQVSGTSEVRLDVFDVLGRKVSTLVNERKAAGSYQVNFNAANLASGTYFYRLQAGGFVETKKMVLIK
jgi:hypothetical protein